MGLIAANSPEQESAVALLGKYFLPLSSEGLAYDLRADLDVAAAIEQGVPTKAVDDVINSGAVEPEVVYEVVVPRRTLAHRKSKRLRLSPEQSDRLARVLRVHARTEETLGDQKTAKRWLRKRNRALNGKTPVELLTSEAGARAVEKVLGRIEYGIFS
jgi:putative toxin-antitoxin system antitoxin component (TIGR02293 family)